MQQDCDPNSPTLTVQSPDSVNHSQRRLIDKAFFFALLGVKERKFDEMDAAGIIPPAKFIGPRTRRWLYPNDFDTVVATLAIAKKAPEPLTLAAGRRRRIEAIKSGQASGASL